MESSAPRVLSGYGQGLGQGQQQGKLTGGGVGSQAQRQGGDHTAGQSDFHSGAAVSKADGGAVDLIPIAQHHAGAGLGNAFQIEESLSGVTEQLADQCGGFRNGLRNGRGVGISDVDGQSRFAAASVEYGSIGADVHGTVSLHDDLGAAGIGIAVVGSGIEVQSGEQGVGVGLHGLGR